jgi:transposase-like protein
VQQAIGKRGMPQKIPSMGIPLEAEFLPKDLIARTNRYVHNLIEQDHRAVKQRVRPMLGVTRFAHATLTITGIELVHQMKNNQFDVSAICTCQTRTPQVWEAVLAP